MRATTRSERQCLTAKIAWSVATTSGMAAVVVSFIPGEWGAEAFDSLRFATLLYATVGVWDFVAARGFTAAASVARRPGGALDGRSLSQA